MSKICKRYKARQREGRAITLWNNKLFYFPAIRDAGQLSMESKSINSEFECGQNRHTSISHILRCGAKQLSLLHCRYSCFSFDLIGRRDGPKETVNATVDQLYLCFVYRLRIPTIKICNTNHSDVSPISFSRSLSIFGVN